MSPPSVQAKGAFGRADKNDVATSVSPIVLCTGSDMRLWPLSRDALPGQFAPLIGQRSLLDLTFERLRRLGAEVTCITHENHRFLVQESMQAMGLSGRQILMPAEHGSAAAMTLAALMAERDELLLFAPADQHIPDAQLFAETVHQAVPAASSGHIVVLGIAPTHPCTGRSYIQPGGSLDSMQGRRAVGFVDPSDAHTTQSMLLQGKWLLNTGMVLVQAGSLVRTMRFHAPDILAACQRAVSGSMVDGRFHRPDHSALESCRSESIEHAALGRSDRVAVLQFSGAWNPVSSWEAVADLFPADADGNHLTGQASVLQAHDTLVHAPVRPVAALGTEDLVIIDTHDALLVAHTESLERIHDAVALLGRNGRHETREHRRVVRPWGAYDSVDHGKRFQVKRLTVKPGEKLSLQMHYHRAEHWVVVKGTARVTRDDEVLLVKENESVYIPMGVRHRLENPGKTVLEVIEVQSGGYLGEDDIVRFDDTYGRTAPASAPLSTSGQVS